MLSSAPEKKPQVSEKPQVHGFPTVKPVEKAVHHHVRGSYDHPLTSPLSVVRAVGPGWALLGRAAPSSRRPTRGIALLLPRPPVTGTGLGRW